MAKNDHDEGGAQAAVTHDLPKLTVEILPDVHARIDGELVEPGDRCEVDGPCAVNLVMIGHAKIVEAAA